MEELRLSGSQNTAPIEIQARKSVELGKRTRPKTPPGLSKNKAKKWRKQWEYDERQRMKNLNDNNNDTKKSPQIKTKSPPNKPNNSNKQKTKTKAPAVLPQFDNPKFRKKTKKQALVQRIPINKDKQISMFAHLPQQEKHIFYISPKVTSLIHPVILRAGLYFNDGTAKGANTRCIVMLNAFNHFIKEFECDSKKVFGRELLTALNPQIQFLNDCRPQSVSMGNTIRWLKAKISQISEQGHEDEEDDDDDENESDAITNSAEYNEEQQRKLIMQAITDYVLRIETADKMIEVELIDRIEDGDVILTYARSHVVEKGLMRAYCDGKQFKVIIVDARPHNEGRQLLNVLSTNCPDMDISYTMINAASYVMSKHVNKVVLGAACIMSNGSVVSRIGTATICITAKHYNVPVIICCETYKFSERVQIDSICSNELGDFDALIRTGKDKPSKGDKISHTLFNKGRDSAFTSKLNLEIDKKFEDEDDEEEEGNEQSNESEDPFKNKLLGNWRNISKLKCCNLKYDTTPSKLIKMVITELGVMPPSAAPVIIRECHKDPQFS